MNKIFTSRQIAELDQYTMQNEPISNIDLMERASLQLANWIVQNIVNERLLYFFVGPGNNGGDALALARLMANVDYRCRVFLLDLGHSLTGAPEVNLVRLQQQMKAEITVLATAVDFPEIPDDALIVDGLFGSGLSRPLQGLPLEVVNYLNSQPAEILAIDIPSGLFGEDNAGNPLENVIRATYTLTFQFPKLCFFYSETEDLIGVWEVLPIGLHEEGIVQKQTSYFFVDTDDVAALLKVRSLFAHKGTFGHGLLVAGAYGKMGAAVLAAKGCLRSGVGLLTAHVPHSGTAVLQTAVPEAMCSIDASDLMFTEFPDLKQFSAVGVGPGIGTKSNSQRALKELLLAQPDALVLDADALNILSMHKEWLDLLPANAIVTPHPKEFERLTEATGDNYSRLQSQQAFSRKYGVIVVLKGGFTSISLPDGDIYFNTTGNPGMATAGSGDVLTGIILGLLAQHYRPKEAALLGVYLHGLAGDLAANHLGYEALLASDIVAHLGEAFSLLQNWAD
ncbi:NAD(P)H-hydrate dehydratase [Mangrovibacterium marinum]|uniref:Bifunctional NAD(P)H-hydrate repair enzyme n=1 Tax=Mangrovibacterium marinum TaxID=1639118 RepID=A0A2T5C5V2_9BACT|nr:NAD(P)H-hydrate dehydratase [Mangrovibacterium marinum]PTN10238.1 NAD(P)H-hydrate epimerase [Mangrovibacterium marinum]